MKKPLLIIMLLVIFKTCAFGYYIGNKRTDIKYKWVKEISSEYDKLGFLTVTYLYISDNERKLLTIYFNEKDIACRVDVQFIKNDFPLKGKVFLSKKSIPIKDISYGGAMEYIDNMRTHLYYMQKEGKRSESRVKLMRPMSPAITDYVLDNKIVFFIKIQSEKTINVMTPEYSIEAMKRLQRKFNLKGK